MALSWCYTVKGWAVTRYFSSTAVPGIRIRRYMYRLNSRETILSIQGLAIETESRNSFWGQKISSSYTTEVVLANQLTNISIIESDSPQLFIANLYICQFYSCTIAN